MKDFIRFCKHLSTRIIGYLAKLILIVEINASYLIRDYIVYLLLFYPPSPIPIEKIGRICIILI